MRSAPVLEVRIPISPTASFFNRVRTIALSIRQFYPQARVRASVGGECEPRDLAAELPWSGALGVSWHWIDRSEFDRWRGTAHPFIATMMERFRPPFGAPHVLMLDADVVCVQRFDELFSKRALAAAIAHVPPFPGDHRAVWEHLFRRYGLPSPQFSFEHTGWRLMFDDPARRDTPPYFNTGVVWAPASLLERLYEPYNDAIGFVRGEIDSYFFEQIALTLAIARLGLAFEVVPLRYNFPNQAEFDRAYPNELSEVRFLHFLRTAIVDRERDFEGRAAIEALVCRNDLVGSNEVFRARIGELLPGLRA